MSAGFGASGSGGQGFAIKLEADGDTKLGNSDGDLHQVTGSATAPQVTNYLLAEAWKSVSIFTTKVIIIHL